MRNRRDGRNETLRVTRDVSCCRLPVTNIVRASLCVLLSITLAFIPVNVREDDAFITIHKNEAQANPAVIAGAGAAITALAAELGISETALIIGLCAVGVGATGLAYNYGDWSDTGVAPVPGWAPWDDLPDAVKDKYRGYENPPQEEYYNDAVAWWALQYGLLELDENGNPQPSQEPDPELDPGGNSRWQKARNVIIALAAGGASVALNDALSPLVDNAAAAVKDFLFGGSNVPGGSLDIYYGSQYRITGDDAELNVNFCTIPTTSVDTHGEYVGQADTFRTNQWTMMRTDSAGTDLWQVSGSYSSTSQVQVKEYRDNQYNYYWAVTTAQSSPQSQFRYSVNNGTLTYRTVTSSVTQIFPPYGTNSSVYLNANFIGLYPFKDYSGNVIATYQNGQMTGAATYVGVNYGQMADTPSGLVDSILDPTAYSSWLRNYSDPEEGYKRAITIPSGLGDSNFTPSYDSFVDVVPEADVTPIPDDEPLPSPSPPTPSDKFKQDYERTVGELLAQPFSQLFPFCLINDLYDLTQVVEAAIYPSSTGGLSVQAVEPVNGTTHLIIPLDDFGVEGVERLDFDLSDLIALGHTIRPWTTTSFIIALLVGSFRFFLVRGGE